MNYKRIAVCLLAVLLLFSQARVTLAYNPNEETIKTPHVLLMEAETGTVLYEKAANERAYPASTTKIMTCILALENGDLDAEVTVGSEVNGFSSRSSLMKIKENEVLTLRDLMYGLMLVSGNDAAAAIAVHIGGSIEGFADMMNRKAAELAMNDTHFVNPHGTHEEEHYSTAADMAKLTAYALKNSDFRAIIKKDVYTRGATNRNSDGYSLENTNLLIHTYKKAREANLDYEYGYAIGVKTGDTNQAKRCLVAAAEKDGVTLISVQFEDEADYDRFVLAKNLFEYGFSHFTTKDVSELSLPVQVDVQVANCSFSEDSTLQLNIDLAGQQIACSTDEWERLKSNASAVSTTVLPIGEITAPVQQGDKVAEVAYKFEGKTLFKADAYASRSVEAMNSGVVGTTNNSANLPTIPPVNSGKSSGPWLFIILMIAFVVFLMGGVVYLRNRNKRARRKRNGHRGTYAYRGR